MQHNSIFPPAKRFTISIEGFYFIVQTNYPLSVINQEYYAKCKQENEIARLQGRLIGLVFDLVKGQVKLSIVPRATLGLCGDSEDLAFRNAIATLRGCNDYGGLTSREVDEIVNAYNDFLTSRRIPSDYIMKKSAVGRFKQPEGQVR